MGGEGGLDEGRDAERFWEVSGSGLKGVLRWCIGLKVALIDCIVLVGGCVRNLVGFLQYVE